MHEIVFDGVTKAYPESPPALRRLDLKIEAGEMFSLVGPSGCGKTTVLRVLSGLESPTKGKVRVDGRNFTRRKPSERGFAMITQQNQLLNKRTVRENIRFPLELRSSGGFTREAERLIDLEASQLGIGGVLDRKPSTLSEGQRRLVQLARCVIRQPSALLMDEPLAYLEDQVRLKVRGDIMRVHRDRGLTSLMATASQQDAMAISDRIGVLFDGVLHQVGAPQDIYDRPNSAQVASFFGEPGMNLLPASVVSTTDSLLLDVIGGRVRVGRAFGEQARRGGLLLGVRPEDMIIGGPVEESIEVRVDAVEPLGHKSLLETSPTSMRSRRDSPSGVDPTAIRIDCTVPGRPPPVGTILDIQVPSHRVHLFDATTSEALLHPA